MKRSRVEFSILAALFAGSFSLSAEALSFSEDFTSLLRFDDSGTLVWNSAQGRLHPPLQVYQYNDGGLKDKPIEIGKGIHGDFGPARYAEFSHLGDTSGQVIRLNTDTYSNLQFTSFYLASGWTLRPEGSKPLMIAVLGSVTIAGDIDCSGEPGENLNADPTLATNGGRGRCGGGSGGSGGTSLVDGQPGTDGGPQIEDGVAPGVDGPTAGAGATAAGLGGGGGGTYVPSRGLSYDSFPGSLGAGGAAGFMVADNDFDYLGGGFGGGGGSHYNAGLPTQNSAGGGGGGGGGLIWIAAGGDIILSGDVLADGGDGGDGAAPFMAGGGGGGAGGSIALFAGGDVYLTAGAVVSADRGRGLGPVGRLGGDGAAGRTWLVGSSGYAIGGPPFEYPAPSVTDVGVVAYQTGDFTAISKEIDLGNTNPTLTSIDEMRVLPGLSTLSIEIASSEGSGFTPVWQTTSVLPLELQRFARFQVKLKSTLELTPAEVNRLQFNMDGLQTNKYDFISACGTTKSPPNPAGWMILAFLPLVVALFLRLRAIYQSLPS